MGEFQDELRAIVKNENIFAEQLAVEIEKYFGLEVGTLENAYETVVQIEERIAQTNYAISLLDAERHIIPVTALTSLNENYHLPALQNAKERLRQAGF